MAIFTLFAVKGVSMAPTLDDGDIILGVPQRLRLFRPRAGEIVLVNHPRLGLLVKRISSNLPDGRVTLAGDNILSTGTLDLGPVEEGHVLARAILRIPRRGRIRWLGRRRPGSGRSSRIFISKLFRVN